MVSYWVIGPNPSGEVIFIGAGDNKVQRGVGSFISSEPSSYSIMFESSATVTPEGITPNTLSTNKAGGCNAQNIYAFYEGKMSNLRKSHRL